MLSRDAVMVAEALKELIEEECLTFEVSEEKNGLEGTVSDELDIYTFGDLVQSITLNTRLKGE